ncbi:2-dehydropantoate 2-reductase N-terminal domain-containing protein [Kyrpidia sp.]|uniref:ketopantoate reductase family protein n=1 Tax=Kyrpidia sp. TaxID=2073077 RepID=UPI002582CCDB|nr:2-dehydropantoate 2-reductase N-terminal domain-containing protein [Kyrpidia sp.]MCL6577098.1 NAD-binding protein [Kyrpidia sp.]
MNFLVVGAGAIGGVIGGYLSRAEQRVLFVDKDPDHVRALREQGLSIRTASETFNIPVDALSSDAFAAEATPLDDVDAVLLAVKAQHTEDAVAPFSHRLPETACVVLLQNGLCEDVIARYVEPERTVGAFVNLFADCFEPGVVEYGGMGSLFIGELDGPRGEDGSPVASGAGDSGRSPARHEMRLNGCSI